MSLFLNRTSLPQTPGLLLFLTVTHQAGSLINSRNIAAGKTTQKQSKANLETDGRRLGAGGPSLALLTLPSPMDKVCVNNGRSDDVAEPQTAFQAHSFIFRLDDFGLESSLFLSPLRL